MRRPHNKEVVNVIGKHGWQVRLVFFSNVRTRASTCSFLGSHKTFLGGMEKITPDDVPWLCDQAPLQHLRPRRLCQTGNPEPPCTASVGDPINRMVATTATAAGVAAWGPSLQTGRADTANLGLLIAPPAATDLPVRMLSSLSHRPG
jgi:hypothetical protein